MTAKEKFQRAVRACLARGEYPSPRNVTRRAGLGWRGRGRGAINDREIAWRAEQLLWLGWRRALSDEEVKRRWSEGRSVPLRMWVRPR